METLTSTDEIWEIIEACSSNMSERGLDQWSNYYTPEIIDKKTRSGEFRGFYIEGELCGVVHLSRRAPPYYTFNEDGEDDSSINYVAKFNKASNAIYVSALGVHPNHQGRGYGKKIMREVEDYARLNEFNAIRLDARETGYPEIIRFYDSLGYTRVGDMVDGDVNYVLYEKVLTEEV